MAKGGGCDREPLGGVRVNGTEVRCTTVRKVEWERWRELKKWPRPRWIVYGGVELYGY